MSTSSKFAKISIASVAVCGVCFWISRVGPLSAQEPNAKEMAKRFAAAMPDPISPDDHTGFTSIFDGKTLKGWDGNPDFWRAEGGMIVGQTTAEKKLKLNTFLIWRGGQPGDFELKAEYRIHGTNSGIQYRSVELPDVGKWVLKGYQADIDAEDMFTGQIYEERNRGFLALRGQATHIASGQKPRVIGSLGDGEQLKSLIKRGDGWNQYHIIARGNIIVQILNGRVMSQVIDDDTSKRVMKGELGFQLHMGPPMKVEFRNIYLKNL
ncbi:MAG TPA: DUF1080 domain-containing protein [Bryobacteraceae bacterium]|jgi:hypothetical protein|nr:DUF1080 domain-containing protein [Bryobacteraceae bacterium]